MLLCIFFTLIFFCIISILKKESIFSSTFIFNIMWLITLFLYQFDLSYIQHDLSNMTLLIFFICIVIYNITAIFSGMWKKKDKNYVPKKILNISVEKRIKFSKKIVIIIFVLEMIYSGGLPLLWKFMNSSKIYFDYGIPSLHGAFNGLVICLGAYSIANKRKDSLLYLIIGILTLSRQVILSMVIEAIIFMIFNENFKKIKWRKYFKYVIVILVLFTVLGNFRSGSEVMNKVFQPKENYVNLSDTTKWIYSYMTFSLSNFNNLTSMTNGNINHGASMMNEFFPTIIVDKMNIVENTKFYYLISPNYTASTYLATVYIDFGIIGIVVINLIIAIIGIRLYYQFLQNKSSKTILMYAVFIHNIIFLFFSNMFLYLPIIVQFIYIPLIFSIKGGIQNEEKRTV